MNCFDCIKDEHAIDPCHRTYQQLYDDAERWGLSLTRRTKALRRLGMRYMQVCRERDYYKSQLEVIEANRLAREKARRDLEGISRIARTRTRGRAV